MTDETGRVGAAPAAAKDTAVRGARTAPRTEVSGDTVQLSATASALAASAKRVNVTGAGSPARAERVAQLAAVAKTGNLAVDIPALASRILDDEQARR